MTYNELTRRHFETAAHAGTLSGPGVRRGAAGSRALGTWVQFDVRCRPGTAPPTLDAVRFLAFGCPHVIAVADWIAEHAVAAAGPAAALPGLPGLPVSLPELKALFAVPTEKLGRLLIIEDAWIAAISPPSHPGGDGEAQV
jgi:hypothetical protein